MDKIKKPRLFVDIDGVIYAHYAGEWQIRPYTVTLLQWASEHFDIFYLSYNPRRDKVREILYLPGSVAEFGPHHGYGKLGGIIHNGGLDDPWIHIDDEYPNEMALDLLINRNMAQRWLVVPDTGSDVLLDTKIALESWLKTGTVRVPVDWTRPVMEKTMATITEWKGPEISPEIAEWWAKTKSKLSKEL